MQLTRREKVEWRLQIQRIPGGGLPPDLKYASIHQYRCGICGNTYYYRYNDNESPQTHTLRKMTKLGYGIGTQVCHDCWHEKGYENPLVKHSSKCRICELNYAIRVAARRAKAVAKLQEEESKAKKEGFRFTKQVSKDRKSKRNGGGVSVSERRTDTKHKKARRLR